MSGDSYPNNSTPPQNTEKTFDKLFGNPVYSVKTHSKRKKYKICGEPIDW
jgi:hypothetical protein